MSSKQGSPYGKPGHPWRYTFPFIDVFFYEENSTHLWSRITKPHTRDLVFPLTSRPLNGRLYRSPRDPRRYLEDVIHMNVSECKTSKWSQKFQIGQGRAFNKSEPCAKLVYNVPLVQHVLARGGLWCLEIRTLGTQILNTFVRSAKDIPKC